MKGFVAFILLSAAVHAGVLIGLPEGGAPDGQGAEGGDILSVAPADTSHAALIEAWETPPDTSAEPPALAAPPLAPDTDTTRPETTVQRHSGSQIARPTADTAPQVPTATLGVPTAPMTDVSMAPMLALPTLGDQAPPPATADTDISHSAPAPLAPPSVDAAQPRPDTAPHFDGATALAAVTSPRPRARPEGLTPDPEPAATPDSAPAPARIASGGGSGETQGAAPAPTPQPTTSPAQIQSAVAAWGGQIQARIARARPDVRAAGRAVVQLSVSPAGQLVGLGLAQSSGNAAVDQAALDAVRRAGGFPRAPAVLTDASYSFTVPLTFQ